jgi:hypothetical protein
MQYPNSKSNLSTWQGWNKEGKNLPLYVLSLAMSSVYDNGWREFWNTVYAKFYITEMADTNYALDQSHQPLQILIIVNCNCISILRIWEHTENVLNSERKKVQ